MKKKLSKFGNSRALIIDKPILKLLDIEDDTILEIKIVDNTLVISPVKKRKTKLAANADKKIQEAYEKLAKKYSEDLKKMAKK